MKHMPLVLLTMFLAGLAALVFAIEIDFRNRPCKVCGNLETEIIKGNKIYEIIAKY